MSKTLTTPFGTFISNGEPAASIMLRIYNKMVATGNFDIYAAGAFVKLSKAEVDEIIAKEDFKGQIQNIKNSQKFQVAEKASDDILALKDNMVNDKGEVNPAIVSNVRQHAEFLLSTLGKNAGYTTRTENVNINTELSVERREQLAKIIDIEN